MLWWEHAKSGRVSWSDVGRFIVLGLLGQVVAQLFITWGLRYSLASNAALLMLAPPISTAIMAYFILGERMTRIRWISFALAIAGVLECSGVDWKELNMTSRKFLAGNLLIFLSVNGSAFYNVYSKKLLERYTPLQVLLYSYYAVIAFLLPIALTVEPSGFHDLPRFTFTTWAGIAILRDFPILSFHGDLSDRPFDEIGRATPAWSTLSPPASAWYPSSTMLVACRQ